MRMMLTFLLAALFSVSAMGATHPAKSQTGMTDSLPSFSKADANGDKILTWKEARAAGVPKKIFDSEDYNHNGKITRTMYQEVFRNSG